MEESGFKALVDLIPDRKRPEIAVIIFTRLVNQTLAEIAKHNGAMAYLVKQHTSAEELDTAIQRAVCAVKYMLDH
jgi:DNA-binding NarL/FixJ family response regulator